MECIQEDESNRSEHEGNSDSSSVTDELSSSYDKDQAIKINSSSNVEDQTIYMALNPEYIDPESAKIELEL